MPQINFHKKIYDIKAIKSAIRAYKDLAGFEVKEDGRYIRVLIKNIDKGIKNIIKDEFCNYVLYLMR